MILEIAIGVALGALLAEAVAFMLRASILYFTALRTAKAYRSATAKLAEDAYKRNSGGYK